MAMMEHENWSGMFVTLGAIDKAGHMWGADADTDGHDCSVGTGQVHVDCAAKIADVQLGRLLQKLDDLGQLDETLVVLTADHGATHGAPFLGKMTSGAGDSNWYYDATGRCLSTAASARSALGSTRTTPRRRDRRVQHATAATCSSRTSRPRSRRG